MKSEEMSEFFLTDLLEMSVFCVTLFACILERWKGALEVPFPLISIILG